jgi:group I intron endonuclease
MIGIYKITSPTNRVYIGQSINVEQRVKKYQYFVSKKQTKLYYSILKYGYDNHKFEVIEECLIEQLNEKERHYQDLFNCLSDGLNCRLTTSEDKLGIISDESKNKMSLVKLGTKRTKETKDKISKSRLGMKFSDEVKNNMKIAQQNKNYKHSVETLKKLSIAKKGKQSNNIKPIVDLTTLIEYSSIQEASENLKINYPTLYYHVKKGIKYKYK